MLYKRIVRLSPIILIASFLFFIGCDSTTEPDIEYVDFDHLVIYHGGETVAEWTWGVTGEGWSVSAIPVVLDMAQRQEFVDFDVEISMNGEALVPGQYSVRYDMSPSAKNETPIVIDMDRADGELFLGDGIRIYGIPFEFDPAPGQIAMEVTRSTRIQFFLWDETNEVVGGTTDVTFRVNRPEVFSPI